MQSWLDDERPILITRHSSEYGGHAEVVVGYCVDDDEQYALVHDPMNGPLARRFDRKVDRGLGGTQRPLPGQQNGQWPHDRDLHSP